MAQYTDQEILESLKGRQNSVVSFVTKEYLPMIAYMVEKMGGNYIDAEDVFQEALIIIIKKIDKDELKLTAKFSTYLYAVCKNLWLYQLGRKRDENKHLNIYRDEIQHDDFEDNDNKELQEKQFWHYYEQLSDVCRKLLKLYWLNLSVKEIAIETGNTENYIRKRKYECKKRLIDLVLKNKDKI